MGVGGVRLSIGKRVARSSPITRDVAFCGIMEVGDIPSILSGTKVRE